jgi:hypothetical protein
MQIAEFENAFQEAGELRRRRQIAEVARKDQELARLQEQELESIGKMTDAVTKLGPLLFQEMVDQGEILRKAAAIHSASSDEKAKFAEWIDSFETDEELEQQARRFVEDCARRIDFCLEGLFEALSREDLTSSRVYCEQTRRLVGAMRHIQESWPWTDIEALEKSWRQYHRGELMDFETFKNELLKAAK